MEFTSVPIIVVCCYVLGEIIKIVFKKRKKAYRAIPVVLSVVGGLLGVLIFLTSPELLYEAANIWTALGVGIVSGASATGANQIIKQIFFKQDKKDNEDDSDT